MKAQGSLEYLLVVGAAILIIAIVIISLTGVLDSGRSIATNISPSEATNPLWQNYADERGEYLIQGGTTQYYTYEGDGNTLAELADSGNNIVVCMNGTCNDGTIVSSGNIISVSSGGSGGGGNGSIPQTNLTLAPEDNTPPLVSLISPVNGGEFDTVSGQPEIYAYFTGDGIYDGYNENFPEHKYVNYADGKLLFSFNATDAFGVVKCELYYGGEKIAEDNASPFEFNVLHSQLMVSPNQEFDWNISCYDAKGNKGTSETRTLFVGQNFVCASIEDTIIPAINRQGYIDGSSRRMCCDEDFNIIDATDVPLGPSNCMMFLAPRIFCYEGYCGNGICEYPENRCVCEDCS